MESLNRNQNGVRSTALDEYDYRATVDVRDCFRMCIGELEQACIRSPETRLRKELAKRYMQVGRLEECIAVVTDLLRGAPNDASLHVMLVEAYVEAGELESASRCRAEMTGLNVSLAELLRVSLKLRDARHAQSEDVASSRSDADATKLPCPEVQDSMELELFDEYDGSGAYEVSPECCEVVLEAIEAALEFDSTASESNEREPHPEYYVGPTRELTLSPDELEAEVDRAEVTQLPDFRQDLSEYFSTQ